MKRLSTHQDRKRPDQTAASAGFTIVELLIATAVFSVVMLVLAYGVIKITREYYRGIITSKTQNTARDVASVIAQAFQFDGGQFIGPYHDSSGAEQWFCIGNQQFNYTKSLELGKETVDAFVHQSNVSDCDPSASHLPFTPGNGGPPTSVGTELLAPDMRLAQLDITQLEPGVYRVVVQVAYGDDEVLNNYGAVNGSTSCKGTLGDEFCSVISLTTIVDQRVNGT